MFAFVVFTQGKWLENATETMPMCRLSFIIRQCLMVTGGETHVVKEEKLRARIYKLLGSPRIDYKKSISPAYVAWRAGTTTLFLLGSYSSCRLFKNSSTDVPHTFDSEEVALQYPFPSSGLNSLVFMTKCILLSFQATAHAGT